MDDYNKFSLLGTAVLSGLLAKILTENIYEASGVLTGLMLMPALFCAILIWPIMRIFKDKVSWNDLTPSFLIVWGIMTALAWLGWDL